MLIRETQPRISSLCKLPVAAPFDVNTPDSDDDEINPRPNKEALPSAPTPLPLDGANPTIAPPPGCIWMHVDTGATAFCSPFLEDLIATVPTTIKMGTAATSGATTIDAIGSCTLSMDTDGKKQFSIVCPQIYGVSSFHQRRSLSLHAVRRLGFRCCHQVGEHTILEQGTRSYRFKVHKEYETDFVAMRMNHTEGMPKLRILAINPSTLVKGDALFYLIHFRLRDALGYEL